MRRGPNHSLFSVVMRAGLRAAGIVGGWVGILTPGRRQRKAAARAQWVQRWRESVLAEIDGATSRGDALEPMRRALLGLQKKEVAATLGEPSSSYFAGTPKKGHWDADTWYYPMDLRKRTAVAVHFVGGKVSEVEELLGPASP